MSKASDFARAVRAEEDGCRGPDSEKLYPKPFWMDGSPSVFVLPNGRLHLDSPLDLDEHGVRRLMEWLADTYVDSEITRETKVEECQDFLCIPASHPRA